MSEYNKYEVCSIRPKYRQRNLTYILGARCTDGVVLIGDRRITIDAGSDYRYDAKLISDIGGYAVGFAGARGTFELFRSTIMNFISKENRILSPDEMIIKQSEIMRELSKQYPYCDDSLEALLAICKPRQSELKYFYQRGQAVPITDYKAIGSGEPYGSILLKKLWHKNMTMEQVAQLGYLIIRYIETSKLDLTVGVDVEHPDNEIRFILAHECAHILCNHLILTTAWIAVENILKGERNENYQVVELLKILLGVFSKDGLPPNAVTLRDQEYEADALATSITGDLNSAISALTRLAGGNLKNPSHTWELFGMQVPAMTLEERIAELRRRYFSSLFPRIL